MFCFHYAGLLVGHPWLSILEPMFQNHFQNIKQEFKSQGQPSLHSLISNHEFEHPKGLPAYLQFKCNCGYSFCSARQSILCQTKKQ